MTNASENNIKVRQICFIFLALMPVNKVLMLPSILAGLVGEQIYLPLILSFSLDILMLFLVLKIGERFPGQTFTQILENRYGKALGRSILFLYGTYFLLKSFLPIIEQKHFVDNTLYEVFPNVISFFPLLFLSTYASIKGLKVLGRCSSLAIWFSALAIALIIGFSIPSCDFTNIFPLNKKPTISTINGWFSTIIWFTESLYMFLFLGHFNHEKKQKTKIILSYLVASVVVIFIAILFYSIFGPIAKTQIFAVSDMSIYTTKLINIGRFDYLGIFMLLLSKIYSICLPVYVATKCYEHAFGLDKAIVPAIVINSLLLLAVIILEDKFYAVLAFSRSYINWFFVLMAYIMPMILFFTARRKKFEKNQN